MYQQQKNKGEPSIMSEQCSGSCSTCGENCSERKAESLIAKLNEKSRVGKVIAVISGKGGVGKSTVTGLLATAMQRAGKHVGILDADITGPSIPKAFGVSGCNAMDDMLIPAKTGSGIQIMSINLLLENETDPVLWRGPVIGGAVKQFWTDVLWDDVDYLFVDMPPGTGDVALTVFQSLPVDGVIIVTSPQELVSMIVNKAVKMADMMNIPVLGLVENYSYYQCPDCGKKHAIFGESHIDQVAKEHNIPVLARLPIDPAVAAACDAGKAETLSTEELAEAVKRIG
jgi:Mrp family chromosome partitioning ATPase